MVLWLVVFRDRSGLSRQSFRLQRRCNPPLFRPRFLRPDAVLFLKADRIFFPRTCNVLPPHDLCLGRKGRCFVFESANTVFNFAKKSKTSFQTAKTRLNAMFKRVSAWWERMDSNHRSEDATDLQSAPIGHSGTLPYLIDTPDKQRVLCYYSNSAAQSQALFTNFTTPRTLIYNTRQRAFCQWERDKKCSFLPYPSGTASA